MENKLTDIQREVLPKVALHIVLLVIGLAICMYMGA